MKEYFLLILGLLIFNVNHTLAAKLVTPGYLYNADPTCREINGRFYLFTTHDPFTVQFETDNEKFKGMYDYHAYSTTDFDHWVDHGSILNTHDAGWHQGTAIWDGDAGIPANGRYYAYIPFRVNPDKEDNYGRFHIGVLVAERPEGPYEDALGTPIKTIDGEPLRGVSPTVVYDDQKTPYLLWGTRDEKWGAPDWNHRVLIAKLKPNRIELAGPARELQVQSRNECGGIEFFESPILFKNKDTWYFTYVAFNKRTSRNCNFDASDRYGCYIQYCTSENMMGPFNKSPKHLIYNNHFNNHQGICRYRQKWYIAYHTHYRNMHRQVAVTRLHINADGSLRPIDAEKDPGAGTPGISRLVLDAFANKREAEEFHARLHALEEKSIMRGYHFKMRTGGYLRFDDVDFADGAAGFKAEVSCENENIDAVLEFRLDHPYGKVIGKTQIPFTKGNKNYVVLSGPVIDQASGIHDIYLVANGAGGDGRGQLFNVNWFTFTRNHQTDIMPLYTVNCGGGVEDGLCADQHSIRNKYGYQGGEIFLNTETPVYYNHNLPNAMQSGRQSSAGEDAFGYWFIVPDDAYRIALYFAETRDATSDNRFDVVVNDDVKLSDFHILSAAGGPNRSVVKKIMPVVPENGSIHIEFIPTSGRALINAIKLYPTNP